MNALTPRAEPAAPAPVGLLAELTHRCPLQCPYCSNPLDLERVNTELTTAEWQKVMREAGELGILQIPAFVEGLWKLLLQIAREAASNLASSQVPSARSRFVTVAPH